MTSLRLPRPTWRSRSALPAGLGPAAAEPGPLHALGLVAIRRFCWFLLGLRVRVQVHGRELVPPTGPLLLAGNHSSFLDGPIVYMVVPRRSAAFLIKSELYKGWLRGALNWLRQIPVHRHTPDREALRTAVHVLSTGGVLGVFPEGTRGAGLLETIEDGIGWIALKAECPIVPVACLGAGEALPVGHRMPRRGARIDVVFGAPFRVEVTGNPRARSTVAVATEQIRQHMVEHLVAAARATGHELPAAP